MRDEIDRSDWLTNGSQDLNCQGVEGGGPLVGTSGTESSILQSNCVLNLESASHGLQN